MRGHDWLSSSLRSDACSHVYTCQWKWSSGHGSDFVKTHLLWLVSTLANAQTRLREDASFLPSASEYSRQRTDGMYKHTSSSWRAQPVAAAMSGGGGRYKDGRRGLKLEVDRKHRKNGSLIFPDLDDFMWLSSECSSPSALVLGFDPSQDPLWNVEAPLVLDCSSGACSESGDSCFTPTSLCGSSCTTLGSTQQQEEEDAAADIWVSSLDLDVEDSDLFWPFDQKSYILHDFENNFLCLSPRKNVSAEVVERSNYVREECTRKITISPPLSTAAGDFRTRDHSDKKSNRPTEPPRLSRLHRLHRHRAFSEERDCAVPGKENLLQLGAKTMPDLEKDVFQSLVAQGAAIETLVGLNEFDGREGICVGCCDDDDDNELVLD